jgi:hypothetical protein
MLLEELVLEFGSAVDAKNLWPVELMKLRTFID